ncbi:hypothetical protein LOK49_LG04G01524 [Camellia lanceoleosa]|uniref:Uncharacterized protein n=1 Tax=Camellia lanceoleosa TaxID=1840588 RepID=A0ACC0HTX3_9ERIC|nr:hypothetical protein LOK49_LG04G01524 [Camellia lanceoleosa]
MSILSQLAAMEFQLLFNHGTCSIMKYFHGQDQSNCSSKQVNDRFVAEAAPLSPSGTARYSTTELPIEFHVEEIRNRYAESGSTGKQGRSIYERGIWHILWTLMKRRELSFYFFSSSGTPYSERTSEEITISNIGPSKICKELDINCCTISG